MVYGIWYIIYGYMVYDIRYVVYDILYMVYDILYMVYDIWYMAYYIWYVVYDIWYMVYSIWYMVSGIWHMILHKLTNAIKSYFNVDRMIFVRLDENCCKLSSRCCGCCFGISLRKCLLITEFKIVRHQMMTHCRMTFCQRVQHFKHFFSWSPTNRTLSHLCRYNFLLRALPMSYIYGLK